MVMQSINAEKLPSFVNGVSQIIGQDGLTLVRPSDGQAIGQLPESGAAGVAKAVTAAQTAALAFRLSPLHQRIKLLHDAAAALQAQAPAIAALVSEDVGKPIRVAGIEVRRGIEFLTACAAAASQLHGETIPLDASELGAGTIGFVRHIPYGVVAAITPFNAPVNLLLQKVGPAIAAGNAVIVKPAPAGTRTAVKIAEIFTEAGWPDGLFNVLAGDRETAAALVSDPGVRAVSFTGSTAGGEALARLAGAKRFLAELGSNAANIVFADADLETAARKIAAAGFEASGQQCISAQRVIVEESAFPVFTQHLIAAAKALRVGKADDPATDIGPMVSKAAADRVMAMVQEAVSDGAELLLAPSQDGAIISPAVLAGVSPLSRLWREEVFGPAVVITTFNGVDQALKLANDSEFGLQGAVFTGNLHAAMRFARDFDVGSMWINEASRFRLDMYPFGGVKNSGVGREGVRYAIEEMSQLKFIGIRA